MYICTDGKIKISQTAAVLIFIFNGLFVAYFGIVLLSRLPVYFILYLFLYSSKGVLALFKIFY